MNKIKQLILASALPAAGLFAQQNDAINLNYMDTTVRPQDDFYNYVNGNWMKITEIPADRSRWGSFDQLREFTDSISLNILKKSLTQTFPKGSEGQKIADLYASYMDMDTRNKQGLTPILPYLKKVDEVKSFADLQKLLEELTPLGMNPFYGYGVGASLTDSGENAIYMEICDLGLGRDYYQKNDEKSQKTLQDYTLYLSKLLKIIGSKNTDKTAADVVAFEKQLAGSLKTVEERRNPQLMNNPFAFQDLSKFSKNVSFPKYLTDLGIKTDTVIIPEKKYYEDFDKNFSPKNLPLLKNFIKTSIVRGAAGSLTQELDDINFDFYGKTLQGQKEQRALDKRALSSINGIVGEAFGKLYVAEVFPEEAKVNAKELIDYLKKSFVIHINNLSWMSPETKAKAQEKLDKFTVKIGYPDKWRDYSNLEIVSVKEGGSYFQNLLNANLFNYDYDKDKIGKPVDRTEWHMSPQTVNAYFNPSNNEIVFPAAILQPPFYDYKADAAVNFGGIGAVIGHEMSHSFDDSGSQFDGDGNLKNWWTDEDSKKFKTATQALAAQYNKYEPLPGVLVNGQLTLGENIADLGGVSISYDALKLYLNDKGTSGLIENFTPDQRFFLSWATIWRTKNRDEAVKNQVKTDPHSPGYFRAIGPLENVDAFYKAFDVKEGDKMFKPENERIVIW
ncbi:MAG: M13 family metallopeptidase [Flavobacteriaceae bacterium]|jgi:putative endopeptidase|nr:M13 family metallopeptidase [Flavobacteriaceae bacterium]